jgi:multiple antibiotic resistance protein
MENLLDIFTVLFVAMGPLKVSMVFAETTARLAPDRRRAVAVRAVAIAAAIGLLFVFLGAFLMDLFHFSLAALLIAGGVILFVFAVRLVLASGEGEHYGGGGDDGGNLAVYPLAVPLMASPLGMVMLTVASAANREKPGALIGIALIFLAVMVINFTVLALVGRFMHFIHPQLVKVAERILGILLAALGVQTIINGFVALGVLETVGGH